MVLDLHQVLQTNKKVVIWAAFFGLLYLVRELFGLIFLTFIICYVFQNIISFLERHIRVRRRFLLAVVYLVFLTVVGGVLSHVMPRLASETKIFLRQFPESLDRLHGMLDELSASHAYLNPMLTGVKETLSINNLFGINKEALVGTLVKVLNQITHYVAYFLLGTLFSFFILFDLPNLSAKTCSLRETRFRAVYEETAESVAKFAMVVGAAFQAQIFIAMLNTLLSALGLWMLEIKPVVLLSIIVFFAGLIPVLGTFISSVPILLLAFNSQGWILTLKAVGMIAVVHAVETYFLNPNIFSAVLKINPILTLIIIYIGYSLFGVWGVLLSVPVSVYLYRYILWSRSGGTDAPEPSVCD
jgi:predicted PurR-regulated permease PerM